MRTHHYLAYRKMCGAQLKQVAGQGECWPAFLGWPAAAPHCGPRDRWIGSSALRRLARPWPVVSNTRFPPLPAAGRTRCPASCMPGLAQCRPVDDWQAGNGYRPPLAETFVDAARFAGTR